MSGRFTQFLLYSLVTALHDIDVILPGHFYNWLVVWFYLSF